MGTKVQETTLHNGCAADTLMYLISSYLHRGIWLVTAIKQLQKCKTSLKSQFWTHFLVIVQVMYLISSYLHRGSWLAIAIKQLQKFIVLLVSCTWYYLIFSRFGHCPGGHVIDIILSSLLQLVSKCNITISKPSRYQNFELICSPGLMYLISTYLLCGIWLATAMQNCSTLAIN